MSNVVDRVELCLYSKKDVLTESFGQVTAKTPPISKVDYYMAEGSIYDYRIFGPAQDQIDSFNFSDEEYKNNLKALRFRNWAHINLPLPLIQPVYFTSNRTYLSAIIGVEKPKTINSIIKGNLILLAPKKTVPMDEAFSLYSEFISLHSKDIQTLAKEKKGHIVLENINNRYSRMSGNHPKSMLFAVSKDILKDNITYKAINRATLEKYFTPLFGGYAITELLSYIDLKEEMEFCLENIEKKFDKKEKTIRENKKLNVLNTDEQGRTFEIDKPIGKGINFFEQGDTIPVLSDVTKEQKRLQVWQRRYSLFRGFVKQGLHPIEIVTDVIPVMPAGIRDRNKVRDGNRITYTEDHINDVYTKLIQFSDDISKSLVHTPYYLDLFNFYQYDEKRQLEIGAQFESLPINNENIYMVIRSAQEQLSWMARKSKDTTSKAQSIVDRFVGKTKKIRSKTLKRTFDYTGRAVIVPDPKLTLDYIGIPYSILKIHFLDEIMAKLKDMGIIVSKKDILHLDDDNNRFSSFRAYESDDDNVMFLSSRFEDKGLEDEESKKIKVTKAIHQVLTEIIQDKRYLSVRFPSLHRYNNLGFKIKIVYDLAIHLHPLVCAGFNADFDGEFGRASCRERVYGLV